MMCVERSCLGQTTHLHCPSIPYKLFETPPQLYGRMAIAREPFMLPINLIFGHLATGGVVEPLRHDASRVVMT